MLKKMYYATNPVLLQQNIGETMLTTVTISKPNKVTDVALFPWKANFSIYDDLEMPKKKKNLT